MRLWMNGRCCQRGRGRTTTGGQDRPLFNLIITTAFITQDPARNAAAGQEITLFGENVHNDPCRQSQIENSEVLLAKDLDSGHHIQYSTKDGILLSV